MPDAGLRAIPSVRLHFGCGANILPGWINIDTNPRPGSPCVAMDIACLPYDDGTVDEILAEHILEHLDFAAEAEVWTEMARVLRPGGRLTLEVPDFEWVCRSFVAAEDAWRAFYQVGHADDYAGCGRDTAQRWGILQTMFFGNQNGAGQYHRSAYTTAKLEALAAKLEFAHIHVTVLFAKGGQALRATLIR